LEEFEQHRSPNSPLDFKRIIQKSVENGFEPERIVQLMLAEEQSELALGDVLRFHIRQNSLITFWRGFVSSLENMELHCASKLRLLTTVFDGVQSVFGPREVKTDEEKTRNRTLEMMSRAILKVIEQGEGFTQEEKKTLEVEHAVKGYGIDVLKKASLTFLTQAMLEEKQPFNHDRAASYIEWLSAMLKQNDERFTEAKNLLLDDQESFHYLGHLGKLAHANSNYSLAKTLYQALLTSHWCSATKESHTHYRLACMMPRREDGANYLMNMIAYKIKEEGKEVSIDKLLLCMYLINNESEPQRVQVIAKSALGTEHFKIFVGEEIDVLEDGNLRIGNEEYQYEPPPPGSRGKNKTLQRYRASVGTENGILFATLNVDGSIQKLTYLGRPHVSTHSKP